MKDNGVNGETSPCSSSTTLTSTSSSSSNGYKQQQATFRERMSTICSCFDTMNVCEQTVALCSLLKRVNQFQSRFAATFLECNPINDDLKEIQKMQKDANDFVVMQKLESETNQVIINRLLFYLPLMKPGNEPLKQKYFLLINKVASHALNSHQSIDECKQILCYSLIHPAITQEEKKALTFWCQQFESQQLQFDQQTQLVSATAQILTSWRQFDDGHQQKSKVKRSNSLTTHHGSYDFRPSTQSFRNEVSGAGTSVVTTTANVYQLDWKSDDNIVCDYSSATNRAQQQQQMESMMMNEFQSKCTFNEKGSGMKDVPVWLKTLRLHKYSSHFSKMTYEQMMSLTEQDLERMSITKGARHKIVLNIQKLRLRQENLKHLEKCLIEEGISTLSEILKELKYILSTPIKQYSPDDDYNPHSSASSSSSCANPNCDCDTANQCVPDGDLPGQIVRIMGKVCATILMSSQIEDDIISTFMSLITICLNQEYFSAIHKRRFASWKIQLDKCKRNQFRQLRGRKWNQNINRNQHQHRQINKFNAPMTTSSLTNQINYCGYDIRPLQKSMDEHSNIYRTHSAPVHNEVLCSGHCETGHEYDQLNNQTESLCLRVTEQALGSFDGATF